jgi:hypothetical protein
MASLNPDVCVGLDADAVKEIIDSDLTDQQINAFINMAYYATLPLVGNLTRCGGGDALCEIQKLLAAHFLTMFERQTTQESVAGEWSVSYMGKAGEGYKSSLYGQNALMMDCSGQLGRAGLKTIQFAVVDYETLDDLSDDEV